jgi:hypothetical protein
MIRHTLLTSILLGSVAMAAPTPPIAPTLAPASSLVRTPTVVARPGLIGRALGRIHDTALNVGGAAVGYLELYTGFRYPVTPYTAKVSATLTRGSRRDPAELKALADDGYKGVISLTAERSDARAQVEGLGMRYLRLRIVDNTAPTRRQMMRMLEFIQKMGDERVFVHCEAGKGRTSVAVAVYRMAIEGWTPERAIAEGKSFGLRIPAQIAYQEKFDRDLERGRVRGYPLRSPASASAAR